MPPPHPAPPHGAQKPKPHHLTIMRFSCLFYSRGYSVPSPNGGDNKTRDGVAARRSLSAENHFSEAFLAAMHRRRPKTPKSQFAFTHSATTVFVLCFLPLPLAATKHFWIAGFFFRRGFLYFREVHTHTHAQEKEPAAAAAEARVGRKIQDPPWVCGGGGVRVR